MKEIRIVQMNPEELKELIHSSVKEILNEFKEELRPKEPDELLSRKQAAKLLQISLTTIYHWMRDDKIKYYKKGNKVYFRRSELLKGLEL